MVVGLLLASADGVFASFFDLPTPTVGNPSLHCLHVALAPVVLHRGERLRNAPEDLADRFHLEKVPSPSGVVHHLFWRR